jgi:aspartyl-tRNA(Asn)/glutamyl-tRNA(Gln) amidotransferase subunit C
MAITIEQVEHIARLARLQFSDAEKETLSEELSQILQYMEKLNELDTEGVEPLSHPTELVNIMRPDEVQPSLTQEEALKNAPSKQDGFFKVPKVIK